MPLSKCVVCGSKKSRFIKKQEASKFLSSLGIRRPLSKILLVGSLLFFSFNKLIKVTQWMI